MTYFNDIRNELSAKVRKKKDDLVNLCSNLVKVPSETIPGDTREVAKTAAEILQRIDGVEVTFHTMQEPVINVVARLKGNGPGKRLVFNGHLDTYPIGDKSKWTVDPFGGEIKDGRLYGRGSSDMKGGIASYMVAFMLLAECRDKWSGELVVALAGDEETMGVTGTKYLLDTVPHASGDAMICGDVGSPLVLRFGQKGLMWIELNAVGRPSHGAHVHKGINAIDRLIEGMAKINEQLRKMPVSAPKEVTDAIMRASKISEKYSGIGETEVLQSVTVNFGIIEGGISPNLIPAKASAKGDIRLPVGISAKAVENKLKEIVDSIEGLSYNIFRTYDSNWSDPDHEIMTVTAKNCEQVLGEKPVITMRVGASDSRHYRLTKGIPTINCGLTPYNLGGPDEYIEISELIDLAEIHTLTAFDYLSNK